MSLTDITIRSLKPKATPYKVADEKGLFLLVTPAGGKLWKLKFRNGLGIEKELALGAYSNDEMTAHGFRAMASTLLNESGKWSSDAIERALAHRDKDSVRAAYQRGTHWAERVEMAQWWSDHLDMLRDGATIIPITAAQGRTPAPRG